VTQEKGLGPKLGPDNPQESQQTGFDKVESLDKMPKIALLKLLPAAPRHNLFRAWRNGRPPLLGTRGMVQPRQLFPNYVAFKMPSR